MELTKDHRVSLVYRVEEITNDIERRRVELREPNLPNLVKCCLEIDLFLAEQQAELIRKSLIDNEIDF